ncbi:MAG: hypothetical protein RLZZ292_393 [Bacteroidota bacterium]|jgi:hypothetical protein
MDNYSKIKQLLEGFGLKPNLPITAKVTAVQKYTCTVRLESSLVLTDVRLKATITDDEDNLLIIPKVGSEVIVWSQTGELASLIVIKVNSVERIIYKKENFEFIIDGTTGKLTLKKDTTNFGALVSDLIKEISNAIILTPAGPGQIAASTKVKLTALDTKFKTILNTD